MIIIDGFQTAKSALARSPLAGLDAITPASQERLRQIFGTEIETEQAVKQIIGEVRGMGPMLAMELVKDRETKEPATDEAKALVKFCYEKGLIILACGNFGNIIRTLMPLVITDEQLERGLAIMEEGLSSLSK